MADRVHQGLDIQLAHTVIASDQECLDLAGSVLGLFLVAAGAVMLHGSALARVAAVATILIGLAQVVSSPIGLSTTPAAMPPYVWMIAVAGYYTFRPGQEPEAEPGLSRTQVATGLPATS